MYCINLPVCQTHTHCIKRMYGVSLKGVGGLRSLARALQTEAVAAVRTQNPLTPPCQHAPPPPPSQARWPSVATSRRYGMCGGIHYCTRGGDLSAGSLARSLARSKPATHREFTWACLSAALGTYPSLRSTLPLCVYGHSFPHDRHCVQTWPKYPTGRAVPCASHTGSHVAPRR